MWEKNKQTEVKIILAQEGLTDSSCNTVPLDINSSIAFITVYEGILELKYDLQI